MSPVHLLVLVCILLGSLEHLHSLLDLINCRLSMSFMTFLIIILCSCECWVRLRSDDVQIS